MFVFKRRDTAVNSLAFSPEGDALAAGGYWGYLHLWDLGSRTLRREQRLGTGNVSSVFFAAGGRLAAFPVGYLARIDAAAGEPGPASASGGTRRPSSWRPPPTHATASAP